MIWQMLAGLVLLFVGFGMIIGAVMAAFMVLMSIFGPLYWIPKELLTTRDKREINDALRILLQGMVLLIAYIAWGAASYFGVRWLVHRYDFWGVFWGIMASGLVGTVVYGSWLLVTGFLDSDAPYQIQRSPQRKIENVFRSSSGSTGGIREIPNPAFYSPTSGSPEADSTIIITDEEHD